MLQKVSNSVTPLPVSSLILGLSMYGAAELVACTVT